MSYRTYFKSLKLYILLTPCFLFPLFAFGEQEIVSKHDYSIYKGKILFGKSSYSLHLKDDIYFFEIKSQTDGLFKIKKDDRLEQSSYRINDRVVLPIKYEYIRDSRSKQEHIITNFDGESHAYTLNKGIKKDHSNENNYLDRLSVQIAFQEDMKKGIFESSYNVIDKGRARQYIYTVHSNDVLDTILGDINTIVIKRVIANNKRSTLTWYAVDHDYIPVKIQQYRKESLKFTVYLEQVIK